MTEFIITVLAPDDWQPGQHFPAPLKLVGYSRHPASAPITQVVEPFGFNVHQVGKLGGQV